MSVIRLVLLWLGRGAALLLALACGEAAAAGQAGRWIDGFDVLNHGAPFWLLGALAALALWAALGRSGWATPAFAGLGVLVSAWQMAPEAAAMVRLDLIHPGRETLKIVDFNVWAQNPEPGVTTRWILGQDPDLVVLQEASRPIVDGLKARYPYWTRCGGGDFCSTMIMSRRPLSGEKAVSSLTTAWATYPAAGGPVPVIAAHLSWPWPPGAQQAESRLLAAQLSQFPKDRMIVAGDFNSTPWSFSLRRQDKAFGLERRTRALFSWPAVNAYRWRISSPIPLVPIDHVYAGKAWRTLSVRRGPKLGSDHYPVVVTLTAG